MPPLQSRAGTPRRIPGPSCTLYALRPSFVDAAAARNGLKDLYLFAILFDPMADEDGAVHAGTGAQPLESGVVRLYGVVVILGGWVRWVR